MNLRYVTDDAGHKIAVLIPFDEWEIIASRLEYLEPNEETIKAMEEGLQGKLTATTLDALAQDWEMAKCGK